MPTRSSGFGVVTQNLLNQVVALRESFWRVAITQSKNFGLKYKPNRSLFNGCVTVIWGAITPH